MSYKSETIQAILPRINSTFFLPAMQREFVWTAEKICDLFDSLMRRYPISGFLFWQPPSEALDDIEAYEFLHIVNASQNRARLAPSFRTRGTTLVLDGQQRLTAFLVGLRGTYNERIAKIGKGARTPVPKKLYLDLLHDGQRPDKEGETYYRFQFRENLVQSREGFWFEVGRILNVAEDTGGIEGLVERQKRTLSDLRARDAGMVEHNLTRLYEAVWSNDVLSYHTETDPDHERILEIFVRANSGGTELSRSDLLLSTLTLHWGTDNAREVINDFVAELNGKLTRNNRLNKDFVMKSCLVLLNLPVAYRVSSFTKDTCTEIRRNWEEIRSAIRRTVVAANAFGIDENTLTSHNALIPIAFYLYQTENQRLTLQGESFVEVANAARVRVWLLSALLNRVFSGSSDSTLTKVREALKQHMPLNGDFPIAAVDRAVREAGRTGGSNADAIDRVLDITSRDETCFLALSLLYDDRNWATMPHSIDHLFAQNDFKRRNVPDHVKKLRDDLGNLALVIVNENSGKGDLPLHEWLATRSREYLNRHHIPAEPSLWHMEKYEDFLIERRKLLRARIQQVLSFDVEAASAVGHG